MKDQPNYDSFQDLLKNNSHTENLDLVSPPDPAPQPGNNPPQIPQWGQSLTGRVVNLEKRAANIEQNMATKQDIAAISQKLAQHDQGFAAINQRLDVITKHITGK